MPPARGAEAGSAPVGGGPAGALLRRAILLLTNSFDLEDGSLTAGNLEQVKGHLASAYPSKYSEVLPLVKNCSLESELDTVRRAGVSARARGGSGRRGLPTSALLLGITSR